MSRMSPYNNRAQCKDTSIHRWGGLVEHRGVAEAAKLRNTGVHRDTCGMWSSVLGYFVMFLVVNTHATPCRMANEVRMTIIRIMWMM